MNILTKEEFLNKKKLFIKEIRSGKIFIYPTDTIYGIGCDATNEQAVDKIRKIKKSMHDWCSIHQKSMIFDGHQNSKSFEVLNVLFK